MTFRKALGISLLIALFGGIFVFGVVMSNLITTLFAFGFAFIIVCIVSIAVRLIDG